MQEASEVAWQEKEPNVDLVEIAEPDTPPSRGHISSDGVESEAEDAKLFIEITLRRAVSGEQLGRTLLLNMSLRSDATKSLGSLIAIGKGYEYRANVVYSYFFQLTDGSTVDCAAHVYDKIWAYADRLEPIPTDPDSTYHPDNRLHRLNLQQYVSEKPRQHL